jgi:hypothetical protein
MDNITHYNPTISEFGTGENRVWTLNVVPYVQDIERTQHWLPDEMRFRFCAYLDAFDAWRNPETPSDEKPGLLNELQLICNSLPHPATAYQKVKLVVDKNWVMNDDIVTICSYEDLYYICLAYETIAKLPNNTIVWNGGKKPTEKSEESQVTAEEIQSTKKNMEERIQEWRASIWGKSHPITTGHNTLTETVNDLVKTAQNTAPSSLQKEMPTNGSAVSEEIKGVPDKEASVVVDKKSSDNATDSSGDISTLISNEEKPKSNDAVKVVEDGNKGLEDGHGRRG